VQHCLWERRPRRDHWRQGKSLSFQDYLIFCSLAPLGERVGVRGWDVAENGHSPLTLTLSPLGRGDLCVTIWVRVELFIS
jgi:hypothetical protein